MEAGHRPGLFYGRWLRRLSGPMLAASRKSDIIHPNHAGPQIAVFRRGCCMGFTRRQAIKLGTAALGSLAPFSWARGSVAAEGETETYGLSTFGELALPADFPHFAYVNPAAPRLS